LGQEATERMTDDRGRDGGSQMPSLADAVDHLADELDEIHRRRSAYAVEYLRGGVVFAAREEGRVSFRLRAEVVAAGLQTADTTLSARGSDWIALQPRVVDGFALDRALAWFESAWRLAGESPQAPPPARLN